MLTARDGFSRRPTVSGYQRLLVLLILTTLLCGGVLGGGPTPPNISMIVEICGCVLAGIGFAGMANGGLSLSQAPALSLLAAILCVPIIQLIPIPWATWVELPGHATPAALLQLAGLKGIDLPVSLDPRATRLAAIFIVVPTSIFIATLRTGEYGRTIVIKAIVGFCFLSAVLGMLQVISNGGWSLNIYPQVHDGNAIGFFANRNHEADLLLIALPLVTYLLRAQRWRSDARFYSLFGAIFFFSVSVVSTISRTGLSLLPLALGGVILIWTQDLRSKKVWSALGALLSLSLVGYAFLQLTPIGSRVIARFGNLNDDLRYSIWRSTVTSARNFWPYGSGVGSFVPVYQMSEDLDAVGTALVNHAHNDFLELILETGIAGPCLFLAYVIIITATTLRGASSTPAAQRYAALTIIIILLLHSLTDYPLRTFGLVSIFAFANGLLFESHDQRTRIKNSSRASAALMNTKRIDRSRNKAAGR